MLVDDLQTNGGLNRITNSFNQMYIQSASFIRFSPLYTSSVNDFFVNTQSGDTYVNGILYLNYIQSFPFTNELRTQIETNRADIANLQSTQVKLLEYVSIYTAKLLNIINDAQVIPGQYGGITYDIVTYDYPIGFDDFPNFFTQNNQWNRGSRRIHISYEVDLKLLDTDFKKYRIYIYRRNSVYGSRKPRSQDSGYDYTVSNRLHSSILFRAELNLDLVDGDQVFISSSFAATVHQNIRGIHRIEIRELA